MGTTNRQHHLPHATINSMRFEDTINPGHFYKELLANARRDHPREYPHTKFSTAKSRTGMRGGETDWSMWEKEDMEEEEDTISVKHKNTGNI